MAVPRRAKMFRLFLMLGGLLCIALSGVFVGTATPDMTKAQKDKVYRPYVAAVTDCLARAIHETPAALQHAHAGAWSEAVRLTSHHCDPVVGRMIFAHHELYSAQTGLGLVLGAYTAELPAELAARLQSAFARSAAEAAPRTRNQVAQVTPPVP